MSAAAAPSVGLSTLPDAGRSQLVHLIPHALCALGGAALLLFPERLMLSRIDPALMVWTTFAVLLALAVHAAALIRRQGHNPWLHPLSLSMSYFWFRYGWGSLVIFYWDRFPWEAAPYLRERFEAYGMREYLDPASQMLLLGGLGLYLGASLPLSGLAAALPGVSWQIDQQRFCRALVLCAPIGLFVVTVGRMALPLSVTYLVEVLGETVSVMLVVASCWFFAAQNGPQRTQWGLFLVLLTAGTLVGGLVSGMVNEIVVPVMLAFAGYVMVYRRMPWKAIAIVLPAAFILVFPWLTMYKFAVPNGASVPVEERVRLTRERMEVSDYRLGIEMSIDRFVARAAGPPLTAVFMQYYPSVYGFAGGATFLLELQSLVPRLLWPEKPQISVEINRYTAGVGMVREGSGVSAAFDAPAEYWVNFGAVGVFLLFLVQGAYLNLLYQWLVVRFSYLIGGAIFLVLFVSNPDYFGVVQMITSHLHTVPVWLLLFYLMSAARGRAATGGRQA